MGLLFSTAVFVGVLGRGELGVSARSHCSTRPRWRFYPSPPAGMFNCLTVMPLVAAERVVFYRERAAMLYGPGPYSIALGLAEVPYLLVQSLVMVNVVYW